MKKAVVPALEGLAEMGVEQVVQVVLAWASAAAGQAGSLASQQLRSQLPRTT
jgi:hypothetical protein